MHKLILILLVSAALPTAFAAGPPAPVIRSCQSKFIAEARISLDLLRRSIGPSETVSNFNEVSVNLTFSSPNATFILCQYKSANGDIPNVTYRIPCINGTKANNGFAHAYVCH